MRMKDDAKPSVYKRGDMLTVGQIRRLIPGKNGGACSKQHIYNLIERGDLKPAFRFGDRHGICVPRAAVDKFVESRKIDPGV